MGLEVQIPLWYAWASCRQRHPGCHLFFSWVACRGKGVYGQWTIDDPPNWLFAYSLRRRKVCQHRFPRLSTSKLQGSLLSLSPSSYLVPSLFFFSFLPPSPLRPSLPPSLLTSWKPEATVLLTLLFSSSASLCCHLNMRGIYGLNVWGSYGKVSFIWKYAQIGQTGYCGIEKAEAWLAIALEIWTSHYW